MLPVRSFLRGAGTFLLCAGLVVTLFPLMTEAYGRHRQRVLRQEFQSQIQEVVDGRGVAEGPGGRGVAEAKGRLPFRLLIPKVWVDVVVKEGTNGKSLAGGAVHYPGTALPGERGNCVVSGHRTTHGSPFHWLDLLQAGDPIAVQTLDGWAWYVAEEVKVIPASELGQVIFGATDTRLTLLTCSPLFSARQRLIVVAKPGSPSQERLWAGGTLLPKRTRDTMLQDCASPALEWLRELAKNEGRPPGLDNPSGPSASVQKEDGSAFSLGGPVGSQQNRRFAPTAPVNLAPRVLAPPSSPSWDHQIQPRPAAGGASIQPTWEGTLGSAGQKAGTSHPATVPSPAPVGPAATGVF